MIQDGQNILNLTNQLDLTKRLNQLLSLKESHLEQLETMQHLKTGNAQAVQATKHTNSGH